MSLWNPPRYPTPGFSSLFRMLDEFDRYTQDTLGRTGMRTFNPRFDVVEHEKSYELQGELPGVAPENVVVEFTDPQTMVIRGRTERVHTEGDPSLAQGRLEGAKEAEKIEGPPAEKKEGDKKEGKQTKYWLSERSFGEFSRVFSFPAGVDQDRVEAKFEHGVLNVNVPKVERKGARKIEIK